MLDVVRLANGLVRSAVVMIMTGAVVYLALGGDARAVEALTVQFISLLGFLFGERSALKQPGHPEGK
jgi:hypothetical protein